MVNYFMDVLVFQSVIGLQRVGVDGGAVSNVALNLRLQFTLAGSPDALGPDFAVPFEKSHHGSLADRPSAQMLLLARVLKSFLATDEGFINFDLARQRPAVVRLHHG